MTPRSKSIVAITVVAVALVGVLFTAFEYVISNGNDKHWSVRVMKPMVSWLGRVLGAGRADTSSEV